MPEMTQNPGVSPFERIARAGHYDCELAGRLVYEHGLALSGGLSGESGRMTDGQLRTAALELASISLAVCSMLGMTLPLAAVRSFAEARAEQLEEREAAA